MIEKTQLVDLLISHSQILIRGRPYSESDSQWGDINVSQGAVIHPDYVIFDPLPDDAFGANVELKTASRFDLDVRAQRCIVVPFTVTNEKFLEVASAAEKVSLQLGLKENIYALYYEICEGDEIFYKFTFVPQESSVEAKYVIDDPWGGEKEAILIRGIA